jgi:beta-galactosidase
MFSSGPSVDFKYTDEVYKYYDAFCKQNIPVDVISPDQSLDKYKVVIAPALYMISKENAEKIQRFVQNGGTFLTTVMSGMTDENDLVTDKGYPGELRKVCGIWAEETDALLPGKPNSVVIKDGALKGEYPAVILADIIHPDTAETIAVYGSDFYQGTPVITKNSFGQGKAWYVGTCADRDNGLLEKLILSITDEAGIKPVLPSVKDIEVTQRVSSDGKKFIFILNQGTEDKKINIPFEAEELLTSASVKAGDDLMIKAKDVLILCRN